MYLQVRIADIFWLTVHAHSYIFVHLFYSHFLAFITIIAISVGTTIIQMTIFGGGFRCWEALLCPLAPIPFLWWLVSFLLEPPPSLLQDFQLGWNHQCPPGWLHGQSPGRLGHGFGSCSICAFSANSGLSGLSQSL